MFDYAIIGAGAAGLHLALAMQSDPFFAQKKILIIDKDAKDQNDRTWCFWEKGEGLWDSIILNSWLEGSFYGGGETIPLNLNPYRYKMLRGLDFYQHAKQTLGMHTGITWIQEEVLAVEQGSPLQVKTSKGQYSAAYVFDSRIPEQFYAKNDSYTRLLQHFKGWWVKTPTDFFEPGQFTMMDYRLLWNGSTSFTYVLPLNRREALVEFTLFTPELIKESDYDTMLQRYMEEILGLKDFEVTETEKGIIPMTDFPFEQFSSGNYLRIGTGGGWVKPSSGYSFKNCEKNARKVIQNLKNNRPPGKGIISPKFRLYDTLFLDVLHRQNQDGPALFHTMYRKNSIQQILAFLDDETTIPEDLRIIVGFPQTPFLKALLRRIAR
ncbi:MAG TPA: lycopene cyclase family protein [Saprospiraceae bacterium]|nr:lycopene cyclase family protein [Saprospiraceae bacterium]